MALCFNTAPLSLLSSSSSTSTSTLSAHQFSRLCINTIAPNPKSYAGCSIRAPFLLNNRGALAVKASSDVDGLGSSAPDSPTPPSGGNEDSVAVENLPLESKLQLQLEQKTRMKIAKKARLRRKRLVRKRHLRKKGRWPPSKLKKNKNV